MTQPYLQVQQGRKKKKELEMSLARYLGPGRILAHYGGNAVTLSIIRSGKGDRIYVNRYYQY
jgi:hypothetical protein